MRIQGVTRDVRGFLGDDRHRVLREPAGPAVVRGNEGGDEQAAEDPLVHEPQLIRHGSLRAQPQPDFQVFLIGNRAVLHQELAAHAEVGHERDGRRAPNRGMLYAAAPRAVLLQWHPEELAAADDVEDCGPFKIPDEILGSQGMPAHGPRVNHVDAGDGPAADPVDQAAADHLDFGQFRHGGLAARSRFRRGS